MTIDREKYPSVCELCKEPAYISLLRIECSNYECYHRGPDAKPRQTYVDLGRQSRVTKRLQKSFSADRCIVPKMDAGGSND